MNQSRNLYLIAVASLAACLLVGAFFWYGPRQAVILPTPVPSTAAPLPQSHLNQAAFAQGYTLTVHSVRTDDTGSSVYKPGTGYRYYILAITIHNSGPGPLQLAPVIQAHLQDQSGSSYGLTPAPLTTPFPAGPLAPGADQSGELSFEAPVAASGLQIMYQIGNQPITVNLAY